MDKTHIKDRFQKLSKNPTQPSKPKYQCPKCDYKATRPKLYQHVKSVHEKTTFQCQFCEHKATRPNLYQHVKSVHEKRTFKCQFCDHKSTQKSSLKPVSYTHLTLPTICSV